MTPSGRAAVVALALVSTILAGCLTEGELSLDGLAAPAWEPGFRWTYDVDATGTHVMLADGGRAARTFEYSTGLNSSVMNTSGDIDGQPVYFIVQDVDMNDDYFGISMGLFGGGGVVALTQDTLQPVARSSYWDWREGCGPVQLRPVEEPSLFEFPLALGKTWEGEMDYVSYSAEVMGVEPVETAAGTFDTVHVKITLVPEFEGSDEPVVLQEAEADSPAPPSEYEDEESLDESIESAEFTQEYWYAPAVRNVVKTVTKSHSVYSEDEGRFEMTASSTILLTDYSLVPGEEQPAPTLVRRDPWGYHQDSLRIITDTSFPYNVANGSTTARFGVETVTPEPMMVEVEPDDDPMMEHARLVSRPGDGMRVVDNVPDVSGYDHERYELVWWVYDNLGGHREVAGDVLEFELDGPASIGVNAELRPVVADDECSYRHLRWVMPAHGNALVYFEKAYDISVDAGVAEEIDLGPLPGGGYPVLSGHWDFSSSTTGVPDRPYPVLYTPDGAAYERGDPDHRFIEAWMEHQEGDWRLAWQVQGPQILTGAPSPVATGHEATLHIRIDPQ